MQKLIKKGFIYAGHLMAACMDLSVGVLIVSIVSFYSDTAFPLWLYVVGAYLAIIPDMDLVSDALSASDLKGFDHHQTLTHRPIIMLPFVLLLGATLGYFLGSIFLYASVFFLCTIWHYIHDTKELGGGGIAWFWPYSRKYWSFTSWEYPEDSVMGKHESYPMWIHPTGLSIRECSVVVIASTAAAFFDPQLVPFAIVLIPLFSIVVVSVWLFSPKFGPR